MANFKYKEINFQHYIDLVKQNKLHWNIFKDVLQDLSYSDVGKLRYLNATLLSELTLNYSDMDKLIYLNKILLTEFKNFIQSDFEKNIKHQLEDLQESLSNVSKDEISTEDEITSVDEIQDNFTSSFEREIIECNPNEKDSELFQMSKNEAHDKDLREEEEESTVLDDETNSEISTENEIEMPIGNEIKANTDFMSSLKTELIECHTNESAIFRCNICNKEYNVHFYLKQHIKKVHEEKKSCNFQQSTIHDDQKHDEGHKAHKCEPCGKSFSTAGYLKVHIHTVHEGHKDYKCESCGKSFTQTSSLKTHIRSVHEGRRDHTCDSCAKSFSEASHLKRHIHTIHEGHKDHKCKSCSKSYTEAGNLKKHIHTVHQGHKDHKCKSCDKSFTESHNLKKHLHKIHDYKYM